LVNILAWSYYQTMGPQVKTDLRRWRNGPAYQTNLRLIREVIGVEMRCMPPI